MRAMMSAPLAWPLSGWYVRASFRYALRTSDSGAVGGSCSRLYGSSRRQN